MVSNFFLKEFNVIYSNLEPLIYDSQIIGRQLQELRPLVVRDYNVIQKDSVKI